MSQVKQCHDTVTQEKGLIYDNQHKHQSAEVTQHNSMCHCAPYCHAECHFAKCWYAKCHYAECRYAEYHYAEMSL